MADKDYTPSETAMEAAKAWYIGYDDSMDDHRLSLARIIDEAYAPLRDAAQSACDGWVKGFSRTNVQEAIRRATPKEPTDGNP